MALQRTRVAHDATQYVVIDLGEPVIDEKGNAVYVDNGDSPIIFEGKDMSPEAKAKCIFESLTRNEQAAAERRAATTKKG